jgi:hypothetical protein
VLLKKNLKLHAITGGLAVAIVVLGLVWYLAASNAAERWVGGSSVVGLALGTIAALIIGFELLLWPRKKFRKHKLGPTRYWLVGHLWFGLATGPLAFIHAGFQFGGLFTSCLLWLLFFVLASGVYGWVMQVIIPKWMLGSLPSETITAQIDDVAVQNALDARRMITVAYGAKPEGLTKLTNLDEMSQSFRGTRTVRDPSGAVSRIVVGAVQRRGAPRPRSTLTSVQEFDPVDGRVVWKEYAAVIDPFLLHDISELPSAGKRAKIEIDKLRTQQHTEVFFSLLRQSCSASAEPVLEKLRSYCNERHQLDQQRRYQKWLHYWIAIHASASVLLGVLLVAHIFLSLRYL